MAFNERRAGKLNAHKQKPKFHRPSPKNRALESHTKKSREVRNQFDRLPAEVWLGSSLNTHIPLRHSVKSGLEFRFESGWFKRWLYLALQATPNAAF
jgi:hypothetical protein